MNRIKLADRQLPSYTYGEEIMNMVTHIVGGALGVMVLVLCLGRAIFKGSTPGIIGSLIYGCTMIALYAVSSTYHGMPAGMGKKVMQVVDHCTIYFLIAGTYTPIMLCAFVPTYPTIGWGLLIAQWTLCMIAATLTAIDLKAYRVFSMICYICMGWGVILFIPQCMHVMGKDGFYILLSGGIAYTVGAILYGLGVKVRWMHSVFHIFVVLGSFLQFMSIFEYAI